MTTIKSALLTLLSALFLGIVMTAIWAYADADFRDSLISKIDASLLEPIIKQSAPYHELQTKLADEQSLNEIINTELNQKKTELSHLRSGIDQLKADTKNAKDQSILDKKALQKAREKISAARLKQKDAFNKLSEQLDDQKLSQEVAISQLKNNMTIIRIGNKVLFNSGSAKIKKSGRNILKLISKTLNKFPGRQVRVDGHTDNQPISNPKTKAKFASNWALSTGRAVSAVRLLEESGKVDPRRLLATGMSEYHPVASNESRQGRAANRRIEIVLLPKNQTYMNEQLEE